jgi:hypothetical protein
MRRMRRMGQTASSLSWPNNELEASTPLSKAHEIKRLNGNESSGWRSRKSGKPVLS